MDRGFDLNVTHTVTVTVASKTQKFFLNAGWRVMPEDEKIKLVHESEAIGQVLEKIR